MSAPVGVVPQPIPSRLAVATYGIGVPRCRGKRWQELKHGDARRPDVDDIDGSRPSQHHVGHLRERATWRFCAVPGSQIVPAAVEDLDTPIPGLGDERIPAASTATAVGPSSWPGPLPLLPHAARSSPSGPNSWTLLPSASVIHTCPSPSTVGVPDQELALTRPVAAELQQELPGRIELLDITPVVISDVDAAVWADRQPKPCTNWPSPVPKLPNASRT